MKLHRLTDKLGDIADALVGWRPDAFMLAGGAAVAYGAWMIYQPAGFIVGGLLTLAAGWLDANRSAG
jgi:hypothetical protein